MAFDGRTGPTIPTGPPGIPPPIMPPNPPMVPRFNFDFDTNPFQNDRLTNILASLYPKQGFRNFFEGLGGSNRAVNLGLGDIESLLGNPNLREDARINFLQSLLNPATPPPVVPPTGPPGPLGGGGHHGSGGVPHVGEINTDPTLNINSLPAPVDDALIDALMRLLEAPGIPQDVLDTSRRNIQEQGSLRERERLLRRNDQLGGGRGLFGGVVTRDLERIETEESDRRALQNDDLMARHAATALQALQQGIGGSLGLGQLNLGERELEVQHGLQTAGLNLQRDLGLGNLDLQSRGLGLQEQQMLLNAALEQYLLGLQYGGFGGNAAEDPLGGAGQYPGLQDFLGGGGILDGIRPGFEAF